MDDLERPEANLVFRRSLANMNPIIMIKKASFIGLPTLTLSELRYLTKGFFRGEVTPPW